MHKYHFLMNHNFYVDQARKASDSELFAMYRWNTNKYAKAELKMRGLI